MLCKVRDFDYLYDCPTSHLVQGRPDFELLKYIFHFTNIRNVRKIRALWVGGLATSEEGDRLYSEGGDIITKCKSDLLIDIFIPKKKFRIGVSVKTCNNKTPTNDQLFFTTASAFCRILRDHEINISDGMEKALKMFCGDSGYRPFDLEDISRRKSDPDRYFWEELPKEERLNWEKTINNYQREISYLLLQKGYSNDPYPPEFILHQRVAFKDFEKCPLALFTIDQLVDYSNKFSGFQTKPYTVKKGRFKGDPNTHLAPRFGFIQYQRGGQKQHPTQLQFNLMTGYFYKIPA